MQTTFTHTDAHRLSPKCVPARLKPTSLTRKPINAIFTVVDSITAAARVQAHSALPLHPGYVRAAQIKPDIPAEIYAYPAIARRAAAKQLRLLKLPATPPTPAAQSLRGLWATYAALGLALWALAATAPMGV